jgi:hypothetical protein
VLSSGMQRRVVRGKSSDVSEADVNMEVICSSETATNFQWTEMR